MPGQDKTGPSGQGPLTGRGLGPCGGGRGFGFRRGFGRGCGRGFGWRAGAEPVTLTKEQEKKILEAELAELEAEKAEIGKRLKEIK